MIYYSTIRQSKGKHVCGRCAPGSGGRCPWVWWQPPCPGLPGKVTGLLLWAPCGAPWCGLCASGFAFGSVTDRLLTCSPHYRIGTLVSPLQAWLMGYGGSQEPEKAKSPLSGSQRPLLLARGAFKEKRAFHLNGRTYCIKLLVLLPDHF